MAFTRDYQGKVRMGPAGPAVLVGIFPSGKSMSYHISGTGCSGGYFPAGSESFRVPAARLGRISLFVRPTGTSRSPCGATSGADLSGTTLFVQVGRRSFPPSSHKEEVRIMARSLTVLLRGGPDDLPQVWGGTRPAEPGTQ